MKRVGRRSRQARPSSRGRLLLFLAGGIATAVLLVVVLISLEQRSPVQSALPEPPTGTLPKHPKAPMPPVPPSDESSSTTGPETFTFYDTLEQRAAPPAGLIDTAQKPSVRPASPTISSSGPGAVSSKKPPAGYTVQIAATKDRATAESLTERLKRNGYPAFILPHVVPKRGTWYRVRVGHFTKREAAQEIAQRLAGQERLTAYVAKE